MPAVVDKDKCTTCGACAPVCPVECIKVEDKAQVDKEACISCAACVSECPVEAISMLD
jgi:NAD-dependent dihydropyrimidine dehydrogenase PreA subunit